MEDSSSIFMQDKIAHFSSTYEDVNKTDSSQPSSCYGPLVMQIRCIEAKVLAFFLLSLKSSTLYIDFCETQFTYYVLFPFSRGKLHNWNCINRSYNACSFGLSSIMQKSDGNVYCHNLDFNNNYRDQISTKGDAISI